MTQAKPSLRALARRLDVSHSSLSEAIHAGTLKRGVRVDERGVACVTDLEEAARAWNGVPTLAPSAVVKDELGPSWDALDLLAFVLVEDAITRERPAAFSKRIRARVLEAVQRNYGDDAMAAAAVVLLAERVSDAAEAEAAA